MFICIYTKNICKYKIVSVYFFNIHLSRKKQYEIKKMILCSIEIVDLKPDSHIVSVYIFLYFFK